jgi:hypothetical protein
MTENQDRQESQAAKQWILDSIPKVTIAANDENNAEIFWGEFDERFPEIATQVRNGITTVSVKTWEAIQQLAGFSDGPSYARDALLVITEDEIEANAELRNEIAAAVEAADLCSPEQVFDVLFIIAKNGGDWRTELRAAKDRDGSERKAIGIE